MTLSAFLYSSHDKQIYYTASQKNILTSSLFNVPQNLIKQMYFNPCFVKGKQPRSIILIIHRALKPCYKSGKTSAFSYNTQQFVQLDIVL